MNTRIECISDVVNNEIRTPFGRIDGHTLCEILVRLPMKSLLKAKCVCKHWRSVIRDPYFVGLHCNRSKAFPKLLIFVSRSIGRFLFSVDLLDGGVLLDQMKLELSFEDDPFQILNPVNGLVCYKRTIGQGEVLIYNPSTGDKTSWIGSRVWEEKKRRNRPYYGFGFDSKTKEHKVVCLWQLNDYRYETSASDVCEVLTVGQNTWRKINDVPPYKAYGESVYVNGVVYWLSTYNHFDSSRSADAKFIVAFDIGREKFRVIPIPDFIAGCRNSSFWMSNNSHDILEIDGCVALLDRRLIVDRDNRDVIKMWIFHDDLQENSFTASNWTEETILIPLDWEQKWIRCYPKTCSELLFQAITGTNLIIMMPTRYEQLGGVFSLYCYDRKKKTLNFVEISTVSSGKGYLIDEPVYRIYCGTLVESLYPVQQ